MRHTFVVLGIAVLVYSLPVFAGDDLLADQGYRVGTPFDPAQRAGGAGGSKPLFPVTPATGSAVRVFVELAPDGKTIARVLTEEASADRNGCARRMAETVKGLRAAHPKLAFYALDDADMYYIDQRIVNISCVDRGQGVTLRIDRWDERLLGK